jgi:hypothetical protein
MQYKRPEEFGQQCTHQQRDDRCTGQTDEAQCGKHGFSRVFHATKVKASCATCNSAFWRQCKFVAKSGALPERH